MTTSLETNTEQQTAQDVQRKQKRNQTAGAQQVYHHEVTSPSRTKTLQIIYILADFA